jgi:hypothetical protein
VDDPGMARWIAGEQPVEKSVDESGTKSHALAEHPVDGAGGNPGENPRTTDGRSGDVRGTHP